MREPDDDIAEKKLAGENIDPFINKAETANKVNRTSKHDATASIFSLRCKARAGHNCV